MLQFARQPEEYLSSSAQGTAWKQECSGQGVAKAVKLLLPLWSGCSLNTPSHVDHHVGTPCHVDHHVGTPSHVHHHVGSPNSFILGPS